MIYDRIKKANSALTYGIKWDLAKKLGCSQAMVSKLESGEYNPSIEQLWKISSALGLEFKIIFREKEQNITIWDTPEDNISTFNFVGEAA